MNKPEFDRLRFKITRLYESIYNVSSSLGVSLEEAAAALNAGLVANAGALIEVSNSLGVSLEEAKDALQAGLEANAGAILILSSSTSSSISQSAALIQSGLVSLGGSLYDVSSSLSTSLSESAQALRLSLAANASAVIQLSQSTSMSLSQSAAALREGLTAVAGTVYDVSSSLSTSVEESGRLLRNSLTNLVNQNSESFRSRIDGLDGELDGVVNNVTIITGSWSDFTSSTNSNIGTLSNFKISTETFNADIKRKTDAFAQKQSDEDSYVTSSLSVLASSFIENLKLLNYSLPVKGVQYPTPDNYWAYTVAYPTGRDPFKIKSYSYMGTKTGKKYWNLEDVITYTKRLYEVDESSLNGYDINNTMLNNGATTQNSELYLKADEIKIEKGRTNLTSPTLTIIGETSEIDGTGLNQGQLFIRDEDSSTYGLSLGYKYNGTNDYARIQAYNSTPLGLQLGGGQVGIGGLKNGYGILYIKDPFSANINIDVKEGKIIDRKHFVLGNQVYLDTKAYRARDDISDWYAYSIKQQLKVDDGEAYMGSLTYNPFLNGTQYGYGIALETNNTPRLIVTNAGNIFTTSPLGVNTNQTWNYPLAVFGGTTGGFSSTFAYYAKNNDGTINTGKGNNVSSVSDYTIYSEKRVLATEFNAFSDERAKKILYKIEKNILDEFLKINIIAYNFIGSNLENRGVIAQQLESIFPEAIDKTVNFIPNVYSFPISKSFDGHYHELKFDKKHDLIIGDIIRISYGDNLSLMSTASVNKIIDDYVLKIQIDENIKSDFFVYGKLVDDFRVINYQYLNSLNMQATQQLIKENNYLEKKLEEKDKQLEEILLRLAAIESKLHD